MRAGDLAPEAAVVGAVALGLGLVDAGHPLAAVPGHVLPGVHLDLPGSARPTKTRNSDTHAREKEQSRADGGSFSPLVSEDGAADVEPHALAGASLHHLAAAAPPGKGAEVHHLPDNRRRLRPHR